MYTYILHTARKDIAIRAKFLKNLENIDKNVRRKFTSRHPPRKKRLERDARRNMRYMFRYYIDLILISRNASHRTASDVTAHARKTRPVCSRILSVPAYIYTLFLYLYFFHVAHHQIKSINRKKTNDYCRFLYVDKIERILLGFSDSRVEERRAGGVDFASLVSRADDATSPDL